MAIPVALHTGVQEEVLLLVRVAQHALVYQFGVKVACIIFQEIRRFLLIRQEVAHLGNIETTGKQRLEEVVSGLVAHTGQAGVVIAVMVPETLVFNVVLS